MKITKIAALILTITFIASGCDGVQKDSEFGYSIPTPNGYTTTTPQSDFKMAFCPKEASNDIIISVKAEKIDEKILDLAKSADNPNVEKVKLLESKMQEYCLGGNILQNKGLSGYDGCFISAAPEDNNTPRTDVYYIVVNDIAYIFTAKCKNNETATQYQQDILNIIGSIQIDGAE